MAVVSVLLVSPSDEDHLSLRAIIGHSRWMLLHARDFETGLDLLRRNEIAVVICERGLRPATWIDLLRHTAALRHAPSFIVASRLVDERLWAEALSLGARHVLAKPFDRLEVIRSVKLAWDHWSQQAQADAPAAKRISAAT